MQSGFVSIKSQLGLLSKRLADPDIEAMLPDMADMVRLVEEDIGLSVGNCPIRTCRLEVRGNRAKLPPGFYEIADVQHRFFRSKPTDLPCDRLAVDNCTCGSNQCSCGYYPSGYDKALWEDYSVEGCWLKSPVKSENLQLVYYSLPVDSEGIPMIKQGHEMAFQAFVLAIRADTRYHTKEVQKYESREAWQEYEKRCGYARAKDRVGSRGRQAAAGNLNNDPYKVLRGRGGGGRRGW